MLLGHIGPLPSTAVVTSLTLAAVLAVRGHRRDPRRRAGAMAASVIGLLCLAFALSGPMEAAASTRFSVHMVQHLLIISVAAPLLVIGRTHVALQRALAIAPPRKLRRRSTGMVLHPHRRASTVVVATVLATASVALWHLPVLYDAAIQSPAVHALEHLTLFALAGWFWSAVLLARATAPLALVCLVAAAATHALVGGMLTFAPEPLYASYVASSGADGALVDQQLAGLLMWVPGGIAHMLAAAALILAWLHSDDRAAQLRSRSSTGSPQEVWT